MCLCWFLYETQMERSQNTIQGPERWDDSQSPFRWGDYFLFSPESINVLFQEILSLWTPRLAITNGLTEFDSKVTEDSVAMFLCNVRKRGKPNKPKLQDRREVSLYPGKWNDVIIKREYFQDFKCNFELSNYPFDVQTCFMNFTLLGTTDITVILR